VSGIGECDRLIYSLVVRKTIGTGLTGDGPPDNGGSAEALLPARPGRLSSGAGAIDAENAGTRCVKIHEGADEGTPPRDDSADLECGPKATAGIDRGAVGRGCWNGAPGQKTAIDGVGMFGFCSARRRTCNVKPRNHSNHAQGFKGSGASRPMTIPDVL